MKPRAFSGAGFSFREVLMKLFGRKSVPHELYDSEKLTPVIRASICTGEKTAGFRETGTGRFRDVMLITSPADLAAFKERYGITGDIETIY